MLWVRIVVCCVQFDFCCMGGSVYYVVGMFGYGFLVVFGCVGGYFVCVWVVGVIVLCGFYCGMVIWVWGVLCGFDFFCFVVWVGVGFGVVFIIVDDIVGWDEIVGYGGVVGCVFV